MIQLARHFLYNSISCICPCEMVIKYRFSLNLASINVWMHNSGLEVLTRLSMWKPKSLPTFRVCKFICDASGPNIWLWLIPYSSDGLQWPHAAHPGQTKSKKFFQNSTFKSPGAWMSLRKVILVKLQLSLSVSIHFSLFLCHDGSRVRVRHIN